MIRVFHYRNKCIGCHICVTIARDRWRMSNKDGKSVLLGGKENKGVWSVIIPEEELERNVQAEKDCPARVIQVREY